MVPHNPVAVALIVAVPLKVALQFITPVAALITPAVAGRTEYTIEVLFVAVAVYVSSGPSWHTTGTPVVKVTGPVTGLTVTTILNGAPGQEFADGITIYVTVPGTNPVLKRVCAIVVPFEGVAPVTVPVIAPIVQLNVVPATALVKAIFVDVPLQ